MMKIPKQEYTTEFRELAVKRHKEVGSIRGVAKELGLIEQTLRNWLKAAEAGKLNGAGRKADYARANGVVAAACGKISA